jgi:hypothetical protein
VNRRALVPYGAPDEDILKRNWPAQCSRVTEVNASAPSAKQSELEHGRKVHERRVEVRPQQSRRRSGFGMLFRVAVVFVFALVAAVSGAGSASPRWQQLPPTPSLPTGGRIGYASNGIRLFYAVYGHGSPVILLHGGLANANYWGNQIRALDDRYEVVVLDSRGHGRSSRNAAPYSYDLMASDVLALMNFLHIQRAALVGWSDGGIIALDLAIDHPERLTKVFAFAANYNPSGVKPNLESNPTFAAFIARA